MVETQLLRACRIVPKMFMLDIKYDINILWLHCIKEARLIMKEMTI